MHKGQPTIYGPFTQYTRDIFCVPYLQYSELGAAWAQGYITHAKAHDTSRVVSKKKNITSI